MLFLTVELASECGAEEEAHYCFIVYLSQIGPVFAYEHLFMLLISCSERTKLCAQVCLEPIVKLIEVNAIDVTVKIMSLIDKSGAALTY